VFALPPRLPPLPVLPVRGRDLTLLLAAFFAGFFALGLGIRLVLPAGALTGLVPVISLFVLQTLFMLLLVWLIVLRPYGLRLADLGLRPTYSTWYRLAVAVGLMDGIWMISYAEHGRITDDYLREAWRASVAYLRTYLPEELQPTRLTWH